MQCPQCQTEAAKVGAFWVCPTHGQLPEPKPFTPLRIFLSNGHLKPIKSEARICQLLGKGFYGRQWLFEAVEKWRLGVPPLGGLGSLPSEGGTPSAAPDRVNAELQTPARPPKGGTPSADRLKAGLRAGLRAGAVWSSVWSSAFRRFG